MKLKDFGLIAFGFLLYFLILGRCKGEPCANAKPKIVYEDSLVYVPMPAKTIHTNTIEYIIADPIAKDTATEEEIQTIIAEVDPDKLARIAKKYYDINFYSDTIKVDTIGYIIVNDSLQKNLIKNRNLTYKLTFNQYEPKQRGFLSAGVFAGGNQQSFDLGIGLMWTTKRKLSIGYDYNLIDNAHYLNVSRKIFQRK